MNLKDQKIESPKLRIKAKVPKTRMMIREL